MDCILAEQIQYFLSIDVRLACPWATMCCNDKNLGIRLTMLHQLDPIFDEALLRALARFPHHQIYGLRTEEKLMGGPIGPLPPKIPPVHGDLRAGIRVS